VHVLKVFLKAEVLTNRPQTGS